MAQSAELGSQFVSERSFPAMAQSAELGSKQKASHIARFLLLLWQL